MDFWPIASPLVVTTLKCLIAPSNILENRRNVVQITLIVLGGYTFGSFASSALFGG